MKKYTKEEFKAEEIKRATSPLIIISKTVEELRDEGRRISNGRSMEEALSMPNEYMMAMDMLPEWNWVFESNDSLCKFRKMNPQFTYPMRNSYGKYPPLPKNIDGSYLSDVFIAKLKLESLVDHEVSSLEELKSLTNEEIGGPE